MTIIGGRLGDLKVRAERAVEAFEEGRARLMRPDGSPLYAEAEHEERLGALRRERDAVLREVEQGALEEAEAAAVEISNLENRDPAELLTAEELATANARRAFAADEAEALNVDDLPGRLESVLAGGDRGAIFAHWTAGRRRRAALLERARETARREGGFPAGAAAADRVPATTEIDDVLERMHEALDGGRISAAIETARKRSSHASDVRTVAYLALRGQRSIYEPEYAVTGPSLGVLSYYRPSSPRRPSGR